MPVAITDANASGGEREVGEPGPHRGYRIAPGVYFAASG